MFDTLHSRHSSESNACAALYVRCTKTGSGGKFCVLRRGTAWVWEYGYLGTGYLLSKTSSTMH